MEETAKEIVVEDTSAKVEKPKKMSYEQLENIAHQLSEQSKRLYEKLQEAYLENTFRRIEFLFKVVENAHIFNKDFSEKCIMEIESLMTLKEETPEEE